MKTQILEGNQIWEDGELIGQLQLDEGQRAGPFVIIESCGSVNVVKPTVEESRMSLSEGKKGSALMTLEGRFQMADTKNANGRIYPESIWKKVFEASEEGVLQRVERGEMLGETDHPKDGETRLARVAGKVSRVWRNENNSKEIMGRFVVFDTESGRNLKAIHEGGGRLGVSSRGQGSVVRMDGSDVVQEDFNLQTWDVVHNPSTPGAYPEEVTEAVANSPKKETKENDMARLDDLEKRLSRLRSKAEGHLSEDAVGLIRDDVLEIQETLTSGDFEHAGRQARLVTDATNLLRDLKESKPEKAPLTEKKPEAPRKPGRAENVDAVVSVVVEKIDNPPSDLNEATKVARRTYRESVSIEGPLSALELDGIAKAAKALVEKSVSLDRKGPLLKARVTRPGLTESEDVLIEARTERELQAAIKEAVGDVSAVVVEVDRSEAVYEQCASRFTGLLERQTLKADQAARDFATNQSEISEVSAKLAGAKQLIEGYAKKNKDLRSDLAEAVADLEAATTILEALGSDFLAERLRGAVVGIAATNPELKGLAEALEGVSTVEGAIRKASTLKEKTRLVVQREPVTEQKQKEIEAALKKDAETREGLKESSRPKQSPAANRQAALTARVIADMPNPRGNPLTIN